MEDLQTALKLINKNFTLLIIVALAVWGGYNWNRAELISKQGGAPVVAGTENAAPAGPSGPTEAQLGKMPKVTPEDRTRGNKNAKVVLVEYSDYECPFCARFHPGMQQLMDEYGDQVAWVYRHYPLTSLHPNAQKAAEGAECALKLGGEEAFWNYSDAIVGVTGTDGRLSPEKIKETAVTVGLNSASFDSCVDGGEMVDVVKTMLQGGQAAGVSGTPGTIVVVDGTPKELINGALPYESVKTIVEGYLN